MDWDRIVAARWKLMFAIPFLVLAIVWLVAASITGRTGEGIPIDIFTLVGVVGVLIGLVWIWRIYRAPTRDEGAHWRFHDH